MFRLLGYDVVAAAEIEAQNTSVSHSLTARDDENARTMTYIHTYRVLGQPPLPIALDFRRAELQQELLHAACNGGALAGVEATDRENFLNGAQLTVHVEHHLVVWRLVCAHSGSWERARCQRQRWLRC